MIVLENIYFPPTKRGRFNIFGETITSNLKPSLPGPELIESMAGGDWFQVYHCETCPMSQMSLLLGKAPVKRNNLA